MSGGGRRRQDGKSCTCVLRLHGEVGVKRQRAAIVDLEHIQLHVGSPRVQRLGPPCSFSLWSPGCRREHTHVKLPCLLWSSSVHVAVEAATQTFEHLQIPAVRCNLQVVVPQVRLNC